MNHHDAVSTHATERYVLDEMTEVEKFAFEEHYFDCAECADDVRMAVLMREGVEQRRGASGVESRRGVVHQMPPRTASTTRPAWHKSPVIPWAAAATLAVMVGYQAVSPQAGGAGANTPVLQALSPVTLRPASRGAVPVVTLAGDAPAVLAVDVNVPAGASELAYELTTADGAGVAGGRVAAPAPGNPLLLLVAPSTLRGEGRYSLAVHDIPGRELLGEYAFDVSTQ